MRGRPRIHPAAASAILAAIRANIPPPPEVSPVDVAELQAFRETLAGLLDRVNDTPTPIAWHAWRWRQIAQIASEMQIDVSRQLRARGCL